MMKKHFFMIISILFSFQYLQASEFFPGEKAREDFARGLNNQECQSVTCEAGKLVRSYMEDKTTKCDNSTHQEAQDICLAFVSADEDACEQFEHKEYKKLCNEVRRIKETESLIPLNISYWGYEDKEFFRDWYDGILIAYYEKYYQKNYILDSKKVSEIAVEEGIHYIVHQFRSTISKDVIFFESIKRGRFLTQPEKREVLNRGVAHGTEGLAWTYFVVATKVEGRIYDYNPKAFFSITYLDKVKKFWANPSWDYGKKSRMTASYDAPQSLRTFFRLMYERHQATESVQQNNEVFFAEVPSFVDIEKLVVPERLLDFPKI